MDLTELVGHTPLMELPTGSRNPAVRLFGKLEGNNPGSSVKDRAARSMILDAEAQGRLTKEVRLIEPTSGNTGIALAMICAARRYSIELVMPNTATAERVATMRAFGAKVILTAGIEAAIDFARERAQRDDYLMLDQFSNPANPQAHYETTGPEIWKDTGGGITHFVSAMGTTGTIMGVSRFLKQQSAEIQIIGCQPTDGSSIPGIRRWPQAYLPKIFEPQRVDRIVDVSEQEAAAHARHLAASLGLFCGMSAAGAVLSAQRLCADLNEGTVVTVICDRGDRYVSSTLFDGAGSLEKVD